MTPWEDEASEAHRLSAAEEALAGNAFDAARRGDHRACLDFTVRARYYTRRISAVLAAAERKRIPRSVRRVGVIAVRPRGRTRRARQPRARPADGSDPPPRPLPPRWGVAA